jgi:hypothetical protein
MAPVSRGESLFAPTSAAKTQDCLRETALRSLLADLIDPPATAFHADNLATPVQWRFIQGRPSHPACASVRLLFGGGRHAVFQHGTTQDGTIAA